MLEELELRELSPIDILYKDPTATHLMNVPKTRQTKDMIKFVCANDGLALEHAAKKIITQDICEIAVKQNGLALRFVPVSFMTYDICRFAVMMNGLALEYVPEKMRTLELSEMAISFYFAPIDRNCNDTAQTYATKLKWRTSIAKNHGEELTGYQRYPVAFVPAEFLSNDLLLKSIRYSPFSMRNISANKLTKEMIEKAISINGLALKYVPLRNHSKALVEKALSNQPLAIKYVMPKYITQEMCNVLFEKEYKCFLLFPEKFITVDMCLYLLKIKRFSIFGLSAKKLIEKHGSTGVIQITFADFPEEMRNNKQVLDSVMQYSENGARSLLLWNDRIIGKRGEPDYLESSRSRISISEGGTELVPLRKETVEYISPKVIYSKKTTGNTAVVPIISAETVHSFINKKNQLVVPLEPALKESLPVPYRNGSMIIHELSEDNSSQTFYYVSDIHIELQFLDMLTRESQEKNDISQETINELIRELLEKKISEMIDGKSGFLLVGGDVAGSIELSKEFYHILSRKWNGKIISILGNHELWDGTTLNEWMDPTYKARKIEEIVHDYSVMINSYENSYFLENQLLIKYKNDRYVTIAEEDILKISQEELRRVIQNSSVVILGGIGYSGLNEYFNSERGLYRKAITSIDEDKRRARMFNAVYEKVKQSAFDKQIIVLTHTPVGDWSKEPCNPNWIYVNGHTHKNSMIKEKSGVTILSDNQIGYFPKKWKLNAFTTSHLWYDPFEAFEDGIYTITSEQYKDFNHGRGIMSNGCSFPGTLYVLKRNGMYMFVLETEKSLCLLVGGSRKRLERKDKQYYYDNMDLYGQRVLEAIEPYKNVLLQISKEVKKFGGTGTVHGCIVDISFFSHIYVNPFDGKITPYWALDTLSRIVYNDIKELLKSKEQELLERFMIEYKGKSLPVIEKYLMSSMNAELAIMPTWMTGTEIYKPSRIVKSIQFAWEQNVIRVWNESILYNHLPQVEDEKTVN